MDTGWGTKGTTMKEAALAKAFCEKLHEYAKDLKSEDGLQQAIKDNASEKDSSICHSHDFCDANMAMLDAVKSLGSDLNFEDEKMMTIVNQAWGRAKAVGFDPALAGMFTVFTPQGMVICEECLGAELGVTEVGSKVVTHACDQCGRTCVTVETDSYFDAVEIREAMKKGGIEGATIDQTGGMTANAAVYRADGSYVWFGCEDTLEACHPHSYAKDAGDTGEDGVPLCDEGPLSGMLDVIAAWTKKS